MAHTHVVNDLALAQAEMRGGSLFLYTPSKQPCGVEVFTCTLVAALRADGIGAGYDLLPVSGRWREVPSLTRRMMRSDQIVFSLPLVAWKRLLALPLILLVVALVSRRRIAVVLHEWSALHGLRRLALMPFIILSGTIVVLSPYIRDQVAGDRWIARAARKCRFIPHPPTVRRPKGRTVSDAVCRVEAAAKGCDIVIGYFGAIYPGKGPETLLDICANLRDRGIRALIVYAGSFNPSLDNFEQTFRARIQELGLDRQVILTGYIKTTEELFALFERIDVFLLLYPEGLTARRSSAIACLQSGRPVVVSAPRSPDEFRHHPGFNELIEAGTLTFVQTARDCGRSSGRCPSWSILFAGDRLRCLVGCRHHRDPGRLGAAAGLKHH